MKAAPLNFKVILVFQGNIVEDAMHVEDALQRRIRHLLLGTQRLFRKVGYGHKFTNKLNLSEKTSDIIAS